MTEWDVKGNVLALKGALEEEDTDVAIECAFELLETYLVTQVRIAEALEDMRQNGVGQAAPL